MSFDAAAVRALVDNVVSHAMGLRLAVWVDKIAPLTSSGLSSTSGVVILNARVYGNFIEKPEDDIDPNILTAVSTLLNAYSGNFNFGGTVRSVDLLGTTGQSLSAQAGYVNIDSKLYRVMTITVPVIINDMYTQVA